MILLCKTDFSISRKMTANQAVLYFVCECLASLTTIFESTTSATQTQVQLEMIMMTKHVSVCGGHSFHYFILFRGESCVLYVSVCVLLLLFLLFLFFSRQTIAIYVRKDVLNDTLFLVLSVSS